MYPRVDSKDNLQCRSAPESIFHGDFGVSRVSRNRPDRKKIGGIDLTISRFSINSSNRSAHITSVVLWVMTQNECLNRVKFYIKSVVISLRQSSPRWRLKNMIILIGNDFFMWWSSICFKLDEKWWGFDELWSIRGHRLKRWRSAELNRRIIRFWSKFGQNRFRL